jgi:hypothetical protein
MIGFGITLPVFAFCAERLARTGGLPRPGPEAARAESRSRGMAWEGSLAESELSSWSVARSWPYFRVEPSVISRGGLPRATRLQWDSSWWG